LETEQEDYDSGEDSRPEREDELPQVVVLKPGDLSAEEAKTEKLLAAKGRYIYTYLYSTYILTRSHTHTHTYLADGGGSCTCVRR